MISAVSDELSRVWERASEGRWKRGEAVVSIMVKVVLLVLVQMPRGAMVMGSLMVVMSSGRVGWYSPRS